MVYHGKEFQNLPLTKLGETISLPNLQDAKKKKRIDQRKTSQKINSKLKKRDQKGPYKKHDFIPIADILKNLASISAEQKRKVLILCFTAAKYLEKWFTWNKRNKQFQSKDDFPSCEDGIRGVMTVSMGPRFMQSDPQKIFFRCK